MKHQDLVNTIQKLVRIPSQAFVDDNDAILSAVKAHMKQAGLKPITLTNQDNQEVGLYSVLKGVHDGPSYVLNACVDTAPTGDFEKWSHPPFSGDIDNNNRLYGRGSSDSKAAIALFTELGKELQALKDKIHGTLYILFDGDEHTGHFGGIKAFLGQHNNIDGFMIGYPGHDEVCVGARGFARAELTFHGRAQHSGSSKVNNQNALSRAIQFASFLEAQALPESVCDDFKQGARLSLTEVNAGKGYSIIQDVAHLKVDMRLTKKFNAEIAQAFLERQITDFKTRTGLENSDIDITWEESWPAYVVDDHHPMRRALVEAARAEIGHHIGEKVCGPSNIGNYLASHGIPALCGFGLRYQNMHGTDEAIDLSTIEPTLNSYRGALSKLFLKRP